MPKVEEFQRWKEGEKGGECLEVRKITKELEFGEIENVSANAGRNIVEIVFNVHTTNMLDNVGCRFEEMCESKLMPTAAQRQPAEKVDSSGGNPSAADQTAIAQRVVVIV